MYKTNDLAAIIQKDHHVLGTDLKIQPMQTSDLGPETVHKLFQAVYFFLHVLFDFYGLLFRRLFLSLGLKSV